ncbi:MAG TPA: DUF2510 domain-containing protein [Propionicimonas sp.]|jgi:hypothetical protein
MSLPAAGWYPQPDGSHRYWDGQGWTTHVVSAAEVAARRPPRVAPQSASSVASGRYAEQSAAVSTVTPKKPLYQRVWFWALVLLVTLPLVASVLGKGSAASSAPAAVTSVSPKATGAATKKPTKKPTTKQTQAPKDVYATLSSHRFKLLVKDPDSYVGKTYVLYGEVTQFDAATGKDTFLANSGPAKKRISYGYTTYAENSEFTSDEIMLGDLVRGDCFKAKVTVLGSISYDTQIGGRTTVPKFQVDSISVYGRTKG